jgi:GTP-binding protein EngB required for normal cell division
MKLVCRAQSNRGDSEGRSFASLIVARALKEFTNCYPSSIMHTSELRRKFNRFRILIIGRANAGKTTILQRVCKTRENPEIYNSAGEKVQFMIPVVTNRMMMVNRCTSEIR